MDTHEPSQTKNIEWYDGGEEDVDFSEKNKSANVIRYTNTNMNNTDYSDFKASEAFKRMKAHYDRVDNPSIQQETTVSSQEENPIQKFHKIKSEISLIEQDLEFYSKNKELFNEKYSLERSFNELRNLKTVSDYILSSDNYRIMKEIESKNIKLEKDSYKLLNMTIYEKLNEHLINKVKIINKLKSEKIQPVENVEYELYLTPDTMKLKLFTRMIEIKKVIHHLEQKIGVWDMKSKKSSIAEVVNNIKNNLRLFDKEYQKEIQVKMETLNNRLKDLNEGKEEFYQSILKNRIDELYKSLNDSKSVEDLIFKTVAKMDSLQNNHEESAYIFVKLKEMITQNEKLSVSMDENIDTLKTLREGIKSNFEVMKKNVGSIKERIRKITNK